MERPPTRSVRITYNHHGQLARAALDAAQRLVQARLDGRTAYELELARAVTPRAGATQDIWLVVLADALVLVSSTATSYVSLRLGLEPAKVLEQIEMANDGMMNAPPRLELVPDGFDDRAPAA